MGINELAVAQRGIALADIAPAAKPAGKKRSRAAAAATLTGPFLSPGSLTRAERLRLIDGIERVIDGVYTHLPLKRARYGFDPVQRLRILRVQAETLGDDAFHVELAAITTQLRDAHTRYAGPAPLARKVAALPFLVEMIGSADKPTYVVTKVGPGLDGGFKPGVVLEHWNGVPIDRAVMRHGENEVGGRPDSQRAWAAQSLTFRALQFGPPPDEHWVVVGYRATNAAGRPTGDVKEIKIPWTVLDPGQIASAAGGAARGQAAKRQQRQLAVDPAAADVRRAKMLLFAPGALIGEQAAAPVTAGQVIPTQLTETLKVTTLDAPGGPYAHLRIYGFDTAPDRFIGELLRLIPLLPEAGLIIDVRGNPGGYILAAEIALQLFTPKPIQPTRFSLLATPFTRAMAALPELAEDLGPWKASLTDAVRNGELYSQPIPITEPADCNAIGQQYGGPVMLVGDSTTYSAGDLFSAGWVDNGIGPFVCVGQATGAGGANVWDYADLRDVLTGSAIALPSLPDGIGMSLSFRRATRAGPSEGLPIEDIGIAGTPYSMTRDDLLHGNRDLLSACIAVLKQQKLTRLGCELNKTGRTLTVTTEGLTRLDFFVDGHPGSSSAVGPEVSTAVLAYPAATKMVELVGYDENVVRQRRRIVVKG
jgi:hypothetical protein